VFFIASVFCLWLWLNVIILHLFPTKTIYLETLPSLCGLFSYDNLSRILYLQSCAFPSGLHTQIMYGVLIYPVRNTNLFTDLSLLAFQLVLSVILSSFFCDVTFPQPCAWAVRCSEIKWSVIWRNGSRCFDVTY